MEPLTIGATVLPFVIMFLQSIKISCGVLSTYKDGKEQVNHLIKNTESLLSTLDRLSRSRAISEGRDEALATKIEACAGDIEVYDKKLKAMAVGGADPLAERQWKKLKAFFNTKGLAKMSAVMAEHTAALSLYLNTIDR